jgi:riboflavin synthase
VNDIEGRRVGVNIIPHTLTQTTLGDKKPGDRMNLEVDLLARYVARALEYRR